MIKFYLAEKPILKNVKTWRCGNKKNLKFVKENIQDLEKKLKQNPNDLNLILEMAIALYGNGSISDCFDLLLSSIENDREWNDQAARKQLIEFFNTTGFQAKETIVARRKLASLLFS